MKFNIFQELAKKLHISSKNESQHEIHDNISADKIVDQKSHITFLLQNMYKLATLHRSIYNDYTKESDFLQFTIRHEFNLLSDELFTLLDIVYVEFNEHLNIFKNILRYNEVDFVITCNENILDFMDEQTRQIVLDLNLELMKTSEYSQTDNNLSSIKELLNHSSLTIAISALLCIKNYPSALYEDIDFKRFLECDNEYIISLAKKVITEDNRCTIFDKMAYLHQIPLFSSICYNELYNLSELTIVKSFPINKRIITQGEYGDSLYILTSGEVEIIVDNKKVNNLNDGDYFGEIAIIADIKRTATVKCTSKCSTLKLSTKDFKELIYDNPKISIEVMKEITNR